MTYQQGSENSRSGSDGDMVRFRQFLQENTGVVLPESKNYLVTSRLSPLMGEFGVGDITQLLERLHTGKDIALVNRVIDVMTTHETSWFRDSDFFEYVRHELLPELGAVKRFGFPVDIWSAACSTGQEVYSISMLIDQYLTWDLVRQGKDQVVPNLKLLGTDISHKVIDQARQGAYTRLELSRGLTDDFQRKYFDTLADGTARVKDTLRQRTTFRQHNLLDDFSVLGLFDVVLCRNVLIYFDERTITDILRRIHQVLRPNGILILSASEAINGLGDLYRMEQVHPGFIYRAIK